MSSDNEMKIPFFAKTAILFIGLIALMAMLYIAKSIIVPLLFSIIIAIVLHPVVNFFVQLKINRLIAIFITLLLSFIVIAACGTLIISQISQFSESWPSLVDNFTKTLNESIGWVAYYFDIKPIKIYEWIETAKVEIIEKSSAAMGQTLMLIGSGLLVLLLVPVYIFLLLLYQPLIIEFIHRLFGVNNQSKVSEIITKTKTVIQRYLIGLIIETSLVAILQIATLFIFGIEYAILLGLLGAFLNLIPYIGGLIAVALPMIVALATKDSAWYSIYILIIYYIIQIIDNNYIVPKIVASKVKINALFSIIVVIAGNALWGISGMFLSIPLLAIIKLIFDHIEPLKPWGFLLGDTMPPLLIVKPILKRKK